MIVATLTFVASSLLVDLPVEHVLVLVPALFLVGFFFAQLGVLVGVRAEQFDDVSFAQTFVLQPLIFLGGVFYSASLLPEPFQTLTHFNPVYYMINLVRYGFLGYTEANVALSLGLLSLATLALFALNQRLFVTRLQAARLAVSSHDPLGLELRARVDRGQAQRDVTAVDESVRGPGRHDHHRAGGHLALPVAAHEGALALLDDEHLVVGVAVQRRALARRRLDQDQRDAEPAVVGPDQVAGVGARVELGLRDDVHAGVAYGS